MQLEACQPFENGAFLKGIKKYEWILTDACSTTRKFLLN